MTRATWFDTVIAAGRIVDGCGNPWYRGDIGVCGGSVTAIGAPFTLRGRRVVDAADRYVTPGFVDPHAHSDLALLVHRHAETAVRQGVTTQVIGNCGMSAAPVTSKQLANVVHLWDHYGWSQPTLTWEWRSFSDYLQEVELGGLAINVAALVGHSTLRLSVMGRERRPPFAGELDKMCRLLGEAMAAGAHGLSTGLVYPPGCYADTDEIAALSAVVALHNGVYASHVRGERETILEADAEAIEVGRRAGVPVEISHNAPKLGAAGSAADNLALVEAARREGMDVTVDNDIHTELAVRLSRALPQPMLELPRERLLALLRDDESRRSLRDDVVEDRYPGAGYAGVLRHAAFERVVILEAPHHRELEGKSVAAIAAERGRDGFDTYFDLILEEDDRAVAIFEYIEPTDIRAVAKHPLTMFCSDGLVAAPLEDAGSAPAYWPCNYGEYPGILERLVRDEGVMTLEEAIRKMTSLPAQRFGLFDRGLLRPGMCADLVVFDLDAVADRATNPAPHSRPFVNVPPRYPTGFEYVMVGGELVIENSHHTGALPGAVLRHRG